MHSIEPFLQQLKKKGRGKNWVAVEEEISIPTNFFLSIFTSSADQSSTVE